MKGKFLIVPVSFLLALSLAIRFHEAGPGKYNTAAALKKNIIRCSPDWNQLKDWLDATDIPALPGWGNYQWKIKTGSDSAQFYFNQGINMYYAFHIIEAMASFKKAERFDPACAMIYWAQALAYGPNINDLGYAASPEALVAIGKASELSQNAGEKEKSLIAAQLIRYSADSSQKREGLNQDYADKMKAIYLRFPNDADVAALYADALMIQHPWDLWKHDGQPKPWTPQILSVLEKSLPAHPNHPGLNHYYIHSVEASPFPEKALPSANKLGKLMPAVAHLVHMPSHIFIRTGNFREGTRVNEEALAGYQQYLGLYPDVINNAALYDYHARHLQAACAQMNGNYAYAIRTSLECRNSFDTSLMSSPTPVDGFIQYVYMTPVFTQVRFGRWDDILQADAVPENYIYARIIQHFARGLAFARKNDPVAAKLELDQLLMHMNEPMMLVPLGPFNTPHAAASVGQHILEGAIEEANNNLSGAINAYQKAVAAEDSMIYNEPKEWLLPARHYLGNAELKAGKWKAAERTYREDLRHNPNNGWALTGYYQALLKQGKIRSAKLVSQQLKRSFSGIDIAIKGSVF